MPQRLHPGYTHANFHLHFSQLFPKRPLRRILEIMGKGDLKIEYLKIYRTGWIIVDQRPDLAEYNPEEGLNIFEEFEFDEHELYDGSEEASIVANELPAEERQRLLALSEAELADEGWTLESVTRFRGPLVVEQVG